MSFNSDDKKMYINGSWRDSSNGAMMETLNPATGEVLFNFAKATNADVVDAINAAHVSFYETREWRDMDTATRADMLNAIADGIEERYDEFSLAETLDMGKPLRESESDIFTVIHYFRYYADLITRETEKTGTGLGDVYDHFDGFGTIDSYIVYEPVGVCALISPWNYPLMMGVYKIAPALAAGNSIVYKPSSTAVLTSILLFEVFEKVCMPKGSVNLILGTGEEIGDELSLNPMVDMVTFTGSTRTGKDIMRNAAESIKKVGLELGGKSPNVIFADADLENAIEWSMIGIFYNQGEVCSAGSRILVQEDIADEFIEGFVNKTKKMTIGNPVNNPDIGAIVNEAQMNKVLSFIQKGEAEGAEIACGGYRYTEGDCANGFFIVPTIFVNCTSDMSIVREEIFGPVVTVQTFKTEAEAVKMANDTPYGLAGAVFTSDDERAVRVAREIRAGNIFVNNYNSCSVDGPWGGYKMSGIGRELGPFGLREYQEVKQISINTEIGSVGWYV